MSDPAALATIRLAATYARASLAPATLRAYQAGFDWPLQLEFCRATTGGRVGRSSSLQWE